MELLCDKWTINHRRSFGYHTDMMMRVCTVKDKIVNLQWHYKSTRVDLLSIYEITTHIGLSGVGKYILGSIAAQLNWCGPEGQHTIIFRGEGKAP